MRGFMKVGIHRVDIMFVHASIHVRTHVRDVKGGGCTILLHSRHRLSDGEVKVVC